MGSRDNARDDVAPRFVAHAGGLLTGSGRRAELEATCTLSFREAMEGAERTLRLTTDSGKRVVKVRVPAGVQTGHRLRLRGVGESGDDGGSAIDVCVHIVVLEDARFSRDGADLHVEVIVPYSTLVLGGSVGVPTLDGERRTGIPPCTSAGSKLRIRGAGAPRLNRRGRGDLIIAFEVSVPERPTEAQKDLAMELAKSGL